MKSTKKERTGWYFYDWACSAFTTTIVTVLIGPYLTEISKSAAALNSSGKLNVLGYEIFPDSFFPYIVSFSVFIQVLFLPLIGSAADRTGNKKLFLALFAYLGSLASILLYFLEGTNYLYGGILFVIANFSFGSSMVVYNAFLNDLAEEKDRDAISSYGWGFGYIGGGLLLLINLILLSMAEDIGITSGMAVRISLCSAGVWWAIFTIFPMLWLKNYKSGKPKAKLKTSLGQLFATLKDIKAYPVALLFLAAYLFYNDGVQAVLALAGQFGVHELDIEMSELVQVILVVQFVAFAGALVFNKISSKLGTKKTLLIGLVIWIISLIYAWGILETIGGFYLLACTVGFIMGGTQALSRSLYSRLIPANKEAEYFSLYEISERGTSWLAPFLFGLSLEMTESYRIAILSLIIFFIIGFFLLTKVNVDKGVSDVRAISS